MKARYVLLSALALTAVLTAHGQLFVDYGGPRNIFAQSLGETSGKAPRFATIDTKEKSLSLNFFGLPFSSNKVVFGGAAKAIAQDDLSEILDFKKAPKIEANVLANYTAKLRERGPLWSATFRLAASQASYALQDPATEKVAETTFQTAEGHLTLAWSFRFLVGRTNDDGNNNFAVALTLGYRPDTNYEDLLLVNTDGGKTARRGTLEKFKSYPLQLIVVREQGLGTGPAWMKHLPRVAENSQKFLLVSPYAKIVPRDEGGSQRAFGVNFVLKTKVAGSDGKLSENNYEFPYSVYVESVRRPGDDRFKTGVGISTIFTF